MPETTEAQYTLEIDTVVIEPETSESVAARVAEKHDVEVEVAQEYDTPVLRVSGSRQAVWSALRDFWEFDDRDLLELDALFGRSEAI